MQEFLFSDIKFSKVTFGKQILENPSSNFLKDLKHLRLPMQNLGGLGPVSSLNHPSQDLKILIIEDVRTDAGGGNKKLHKTLSPLFFT